VHRNLIGALFEMVSIEELVPDRGWTSVTQYKTN
jgi:hypothetical protein